MLSRTLFLFPKFRLDLIAKGLELKIVVLVMPFRNVPRSIAPLLTGYVWFNKVVQSTHPS